MGTNFDYSFRQNQDNTDNGVTGMQSQDKAELSDLLYWAHISPTTTSTKRRGKESEGRWKGGKEKKNRNGGLELYLEQLLFPQLKVWP